MSAEPHMLLVDDAAALRRSLVRLFQRRGWRVTEARDGVEALSLLRTTSFDLLLTDMRMPRMGGMGLMEAIRSELGASMPAVVLSGYHDHSEARLRELGVVAVLAKPADPAELLDVCTRSVGGVHPAASDPS